MGELERYDFEWAGLPQIHSWMQQGDGIGAVQRATDGLQGLAEHLAASQVRVRETLAAIGVGWRGVAGDGAADATQAAGDWGELAAPLVIEGGDRTFEFAALAEEMRSRMPALAELEPTPEERLAEQMPIVGGLVSQRMRDERRMRVTQEARDAMVRWQETAHATYDSVPRLSPVPKVTVQAASPPGFGTATVDDPGSGRGTAVRPGVPALPTPPVNPPNPPNPVGQPPVIPAPNLPAAPGPGAPGPGTPTAPPVPVHPPGGQLPPGSPGLPGAPLPGGPGERGGGDGVAGRGPGSGRGGHQPGRGVAQPGLPGRGGMVGRPGGNLAASPAAGPAAGTGSAAAGARGGGGLMQPAVGRGAGGKDEDAGHRSKYGLVTDEHFTRGVQKVAPPVIGAVGTDR